MSAIVHFTGPFNGDFEMPLSVQSLAAFRRWTTSAQFPRTGRIDFVGGRIEVDMSPEMLFSHGRVKVELVRSLGNIIDEDDLGMLLTDSMRVVHPDADLSVEPDLVFVSHASLKSQAVQLKPAQSDAADVVELVGGPDLIVEVVSDSSVHKDTRDLPIAYFTAGVCEYWLVDARQEPLVFRIQVRTEREFVPVAVDRDGYQRSDTLGHRFRLEGSVDSSGYRRYRLMSMRL